MVTVYGNALLRRGHHVTVVYPKRMISAREAVRQTIRRVVKGEKDHLDSFRGRLLEVPAMKEEFVPPGDAVVATAWQTAYWAHGLPPECGRRFYFVQGYEKILAPESQQEMVDASYRLPLTKIVISRWLKKTIEAVSGEEDIPLVPNGKDFHLSEYAGEGLQRRYDVGMVYSDMAFKGASDGLSAFRMVLEKKPDLKLVMFGSDRLLREKCMDFPLDAITFHLRPPQDTIRNLYLNTRVWVSPSLLEGFCLPALEAMSLGCVVVATNSKGVEDVVDNGTNGFLVEPRKPDVLAEKILEILENRDLERSLATAALKKSEQFSWETSTDLMEELFKSGATHIEEDGYTEGAER